MGSLSDPVLLFRYLVETCPAVGLQRVTDNGGVPCGWDGLNDPCELPGAAYCDEECAGTGMGCTAFDCDFYAEAITTGASNSGDLEFCLGRNCATLC